MKRLNFLLKTFCATLALITFAHAQVLTEGNDFRAVQAGLSVGRVPPSAERVTKPSENAIKVTKPSDLNMTEALRRKIFFGVPKIEYKSRDGETSYCTGVVIASGVVITAAHCLCGVASSYKLIFTLPIDRSAVIGGAKNLITTVKTFLRPILFDPGFCRRGKISAGADIGLLRFKPKNGKTPEEDNIFSIRHMLDVYRDKQTKNLIVAGYGLNENGIAPETIQTGVIGILSHFCSNGIAGCAQFREFMLSNPLSGQSEILTDTCEGDSGGPVLYEPPMEESDNTFVLTLVGITSRVIKGSTRFSKVNCGGGGIYTSLAHSDIQKWLLTQGIYFR